MPFAWAWRCLVQADDTRWLGALATARYVCVMPRHDGPRTLRERLVEDEVLYLRQEAGQVFADQLERYLDGLMHAALPALGVSWSLQCTEVVLQAVRKSVCGTWGTEDQMQACLSTRQLDEQVGEHAQEFARLELKNVRLVVPGAIEFKELDSLGARLTAVEERCESEQWNIDVNDACTLLFGAQCFHHQLWFQALPRGTLQERGSTLAKLVLLYVARHLPRTPSQQDALIRPYFPATQRMAEASPGAFNATDLEKAQDYNRFMRDKGYECKDARPLSYAKSTNLVHQRVEQCLREMDDVGGWLVGAGG